MYLFALLFLQDASGRAKALEGKLTTLIEERDAALQNVQDTTHNMEASLDNMRLRVKGTTLTLLAEDSSRHKGLSEVWAKCPEIMLGEPSRVSMRFQLANGCTQNMWVFLGYICAGGE